MNRIRKYAKNNPLEETKFLFIIILVIFIVVFYNYCKKYYKYEKEEFFSETYKKQFLLLINKIKSFKSICSWKKSILPMIIVILIVLFYFNNNFNQTMPSTEANFLIQNTTEETIPSIKQTTEETSKPDFTIETLISLCQDNHLSQLIQQQGLNGFLIYKNMEHIEEEHSLTWRYTCSLSYQNREYELQIPYWPPKTALSYGHIDYEIDSVVLVELETEDQQLLYSSEPRFTANTDILSFLSKQYHMEQYMTLSIPENYHLGYYKVIDSILDEWQIITDKEENYKKIPHGFTPESWYAPGGIGIFHNMDLLQFENGQLTNISLLGNHYWLSSEPEPIDGCEVSALLVEYTFDLFTAPEWEEYKKEYGETTSPSSCFWYIFLAKENNPNIYAIFLNQNYFSKEDAIRLAQSIQFTENAF